MNTGTEASLFIDIVFWVIAAATIVSAIAVVQLRNLFRAALFLVVTLLGVAGMFVLLRAEFLAAIQVLIYVGAISVLIIFAILMTADVEEGSPYNRLRVPAGVVAGLFLAAAIFVIINTQWQVIDDAGFLRNAQGELTQVGQRVADVFSNTVPRLASLLLRDYVLAFEIASALLLAAVIGALALIRER